MGPGIKLGPPALRVQSLSHWTTREVSQREFKSSFSMEKTKTKKHIFAGKREGYKVRGARDG